MTISLTQTDIAEIEEPVVNIRPSTGWVSLNLREVWEYRELLFFLVWRDVKVRYKQTALGASWAILQPLTTMVVFSIFFGGLAKIPSNGIPYPVFSFAALVPWAFFAGGLSRASDSLVSSAHLINKVYFPRLVIPISNVLVGFVDFALAFVILLVMMFFMGIYPTVNIIWLPVFLLLEFVTALGIGLWLSALNVKYRDVRYIVPFLTQVWLFATPIAYPSSLVPTRWRLLYGLVNPMVGVIEGFRWALLSGKMVSSLDCTACLLGTKAQESLMGTQAGPGPIVMVSCIISILLLVFGAMYFRNTEKRFADIV